VKGKRKISRNGEPAARRIIRKPEVRRRTGYSDTTIWRKEKSGTFPERILLSADGMAVGWFEDEVDEWIQSRVRQSGKRPPVQWRGGPTPRERAAEYPQAEPLSQEG
jgi:prophage regulatory protein